MIRNRSVRGIVRVGQAAQLGAIVMVSTLTVTSAAAQMTNQIIKQGPFEDLPIVPVFVDVTTPEMGDEDGHSRGAAWGDYNNDGYLDLYVTNWVLGPNRLHRNNGDGTFTRVQGTPLDDTGFGGRATWADYDNDGDLDLYLVNSGDNKLFRNDGDDVFTDVTPELMAHDGLSRCAAWGDFDNDGLVDLYLSVSGVNIQGDINLLFKNFGNDVFGLLSHQALELPERVGRGVSWSDFDNDGDLDLYVANGGPPEAGPKDPPVNDTNALIRNDGAGHFSEITPTLLQLQDNSRAVTWVDFDNDLDMDLYVTTGSAGQNSLFVNTDEGFVLFDDPVIGGDGRTRDAAWGDFDNDGDLDLYLSRLFDNKLLENNGKGAFHDVTAGELGNAANGRGVAWADYDNDGDLDLFNATSARNTLFRNDTPSDYSWLKVRLVGTISNRSAIGARIIVKIGEHTQMREVAAGEGYLSHRPLEQHFGLRHYQFAEEVRIQWPSSGIEQVFTNVIANQTLTIIEQAQTPDLNGDSVVNGADLALMLSAWGTAEAIGDVNGDGVVDGADLALMLSSWGESK